MSRSASPSRAPVPITALHSRSPARALRVLIAWSPQSNSRLSSRKTNREPDRTFSSDPTVPGAGGSDLVRLAPVRSIDVVAGNPSRINRLDHSHGHLSALPLQHALLRLNCVAHLVVMRPRSLHVCARATLRLAARNFPLAP